MMQTNVFSAALVVAALAVPTPAAALTGAELLTDVCVATLPRFEDAPQRAVARGGRATRYDASLFEQIKLWQRLSFMFSDGPGTVQRLLLNIAWGNLDYRPAASCVVIDKGGIALDDFGDKITIREIRVRPEKILYTTVADAVAEDRDGRRLWLTFTLMPGQNDPRNGRAIAVVTLMSSVALDAPMERAR